jgi:hypothetical protein
MSWDRANETTWLKQNPLSLMDIICWLEIYNGAVTALATVVIGVFTFTIWLVASRQLRVARETERAYLSANGLVGFNQVFVVRVTNNGKTPGELLSVAVDFFDDNAIPPAPSYVWHIRRRVFAPNEQDVEILISAPMPNNLQRPLAYGAIHYLDIWQEEHMYGFVLRIHPAVPGQLSGVGADVPSGIPAAYFART